MNRVEHKSIWIYPLFFSSHPRDAIAILFSTTLTYQLKIINHARKKEDNIKTHTQKSSC